MRRFVRGVALSVVCILGSLAGGGEPLKQPLRFIVNAGQQERAEARVTCLLPQPLAGGGAVRLVETTAGQEAPVPVQIDPDGPRLWWIASGKTPAGGTRTYRLEAGNPANTPFVTTVDSPRTVEVLFDSKPLLRYNKAHVEPASGIDPRYGRSGHLHPVWTPKGAVVTDELPPDHLHQSGIFLAYTKTQFAGRDVDFWNLAGGKGRVRFKHVERVISGPVFAEIDVAHEHVDLSGSEPKVEIGATEGGQVALVEKWKLRVWNAGLGSGYWLLDIASAASTASNSPLRLPEYHYGGMAIRGARPWTPEHVRFLTSLGDDRRRGNHTRVRWCDVTGDIDGQPAGATLMTHPANFRFPEPLRIHPTMPYMVYTPSFIGAWEIRPGRVHESRYQFVIHDGELPAATLDRLWQDFAEPLTATVAQ